MTFRRLKNTRDVNIKPPVYLSHPLIKGGNITVRNLKGTLNMLKIFFLNILGITERLSTHSVKLINSGPHSQITNHGFSRQNVDGNFYNY